MENLTEDQVAEYRKVFESVDKNGDGKVSFSELMTFMNISEEVAKEKIAQADKNGDGFVDFEEFCLQMAKESKN